MARQLKVAWSLEWPGNFDGQKMTVLARPHGTGNFTLQSSNADIAADQPDDYFDRADNMDYDITVSARLEAVYYETVKHFQITTPPAVSGSGGGLTVSEWDV